MDNKKTESSPNSAETGKHAPGVSGQPSGPHEGPVAGGADNTRGENVPSREGHSGGAKKGKFDPETHSPQGSHAAPSDERGADSSDKEFRNNQPNDSTSQAGGSNS
ncbi:hypothetical protein HNQ93_000908 [Hymenobacter luteus]|uniref:Uncharacterized protein n=2 Tax=Hymenobacter TaxID=89966 RepID=A0A7W9SYY7_9BACT|nr:MULTISPECIES: hypothetical protein [Hymenobacter]MBB4599612.1 hypothetical protein [Hymenobacter latericoloratus]MBB6058078.1 hypothetical protein [Hymenobacter luteus]